MPVLWQTRRPPMRLSTCQTPPRLTRPGTRLASHDFSPFDRPGRPLRATIVVDPSVEFKAIEANALVADGDFGEVWTHLGVEPVAVHAEVGWRVAKSDDARLHGRTAGAPHAVPSLVRRSPEAIGRADARQPLDQPALEIVALDIWRCARRESASTTCCSGSTHLDPERAASCQSASATCTDLPGSLAAHSSQVSGTGPLVNRPSSGCVAIGHTNTNPQLRHFPCLATGTR